MSNEHPFENIPLEEEITDLSEFFKTFGDPTRLRILFFLAQGEKNVQSITEELGIQQATISHQLSTLRMLRLVSYRKEGRKVFYSLDDHHIFDILKIGIHHIQEGQR